MKTEGSKKSDEIKKTVSNAEEEKKEEEKKEEISYAEKYPNYKYYEFPDGSIYFGDTIQIGKNGQKITDISAITDEEEKKAIQTLKHGYGIMLYKVKKLENGKTTYECKYEGKWEKDKKKGKGKLIYPDGSKYEGKFDNDLFEGEGKFFSSKGYKFTGNFIQGRMEGNGVFIHPDGHKLEGMFKNNYYYCKENSCFIYPYLSKDEIDMFKLKNSDFSSKNKPKFEKFSRENLIKITNQTELMKAIDKTKQENKIALIVRGDSKQSLTKEDIFSFFGESYKEMDLRYFYIQLHKNSMTLNIDIFEELKQIVTDAMTKGLFLILNFDDCKSQYDYNFDPDIREFYGTMMLSPFMWNPELFIKDKCSSAHLNYRDDLKIDKNFKLVCYSKFICNETIQEHDLLNYIEKRFEKCFPLVNMNVIIYTEKKNEET